MRCRTFADGHNVPILRASWEKSRSTVPTSRCSSRASASRSDPRSTGCYWSSGVNGDGRCAGIACISASAVRAARVAPRPFKSTSRGSARNSVRRCTSKRCGVGATGSGCQSLLERAPENPETEPGGRSGARDEASKWREPEIVKISGSSRLRVTPSRLQVAVAARASDCAAADEPDPAGTTWFCENT